jgi:hypothetical protein
VLKSISGRGNLKIFYGESLVEAMSNEAETLDEIKCNDDTSIILDKSRAFRYVRIEKVAAVKIEEIEALYEYLPLKDIGSFTSSDPLLNKIWEVSDYTFRLTAREFFIDGIKRDRWLWSGDAIQSYLMNYYTHNDHEIVKRTITALRGKEPVYVHINTILEYSFFWIISVYDYYFYTGDKEFIRNIYPKVESLIDFCEGRLNKNGFVEGKAGDWVFVDWTDYPMSKDGELSYEQILYYQSLLAFSKISAVTGNDNNMRFYQKESEKFLEKLNSNFLIGDNLYAHGRNNNKPDTTIFKQPNIIALYYDMVKDEESKKLIKNRVLLNPEIPGIITPYMKFYELSALCKLDEQALVLEMIRSFWGGMLKEGATTFWETYDLKQKGDEHYLADRPDRPYSKSLCHNWGASPLYILGRYFLGVEPLSPGYESYLVEPKLGDLKWIKGVVPVNSGQVNIYADEHQLKVRSDKPGGICRFKSNKKPRGIDSKQIGNNYYQFEINEINKEYVVEIN